jgi:hypothetical protein
MGAICSSETSVDTQRTRRCYIPEDNTLNNHRCENLKSYSVNVFTAFSRMLWVCARLLQPFTLNKHRNKLREDALLRSDAEERPVSVFPFTERLWIKVDIFRWLYIVN